MEKPRSITEPQFRAALSRLNYLLPQISPRKRITIQFAEFDFDNQNFSNQTAEGVIVTVDFMLYAYSYPEPGTGRNVTVLKWRLDPDLNLVDGETDPLHDRNVKEVNGIHTNAVADYQARTFSLKALRRPNAQA